MTKYTCRQHKRWLSCFSRSCKKFVPSPILRRKKCIKNSTHTAKQQNCTTSELKLTQYTWRQHLSLHVRIIKSLIRRACTLTPATLPSTGDLSVLQQSVIFLRQLLRFRASNRHKSVTGQKPFLLRGFPWNCGSVARTGQHINLSRSKRSIFQHMMKSSIKGVGLGFGTPRCHACCLRCAALHLMLWCPDGNREGSERCLVSGMRVSFIIVEKSRPGMRQLNRQDEACDGYIVELWSGMEIFVSLLKIKSTKRRLGCLHRIYINFSIRVEFTSFN